MSDQTENPGFIPPHMMMNAPPQCTVPDVLSINTPKHYDYEVYSGGQLLDMARVRYADAQLGIVVMLEMVEMKDGIYRADRDYATDTLKYDIVRGKVEIRRRS